MREKRIEGGEDLGRGGTSLGGDGLDLQRLRKAIDGCRIDRQGGWSLSQRLGLQPECVEQDDGGQRQKQDPEREPDLRRGLQKSTLS
ncbi:hypothetical protein H9L15_03775 [Sphingomonas daechungensis]|uniref:Uncharacterized protein n=1 Tax=Sphingomonas daechungensis TaxID=1176646 RepID=A0ABX6T442_9SPHN|nr:hypothetical protein [Sphingomonas daechungensis]QNP43785.1 hypothetical protein H9L15_03775 [Sphingomonas daechungensis]